ncbi:MAG: class I SAM-dependent methyltransferase [Dehalococcoidia bacterium]|nr:class I SAM-dependent methyltransferase [Dehalococcoidia bacterium]
MVQPGETWLDIGAGAGRYALPLALAGASVVALDPSKAMLAGLREAMTEFEVGGIKAIEARWPTEDPPVADVAFIAHVSYDIAEIGPFLDAMEASARRMCVAVLLSRRPPRRPPDSGPPSTASPAICCLPFRSSWLSCSRAESSSTSGSANAARWATPRSRRSKASPGSSFSSNPMARAPGACTKSCPPSPTNATAATTFPIARRHSASSAGSHKDLGHADPGVAQGHCLAPLRGIPQSLTCA